MSGVNEDHERQVVPLWRSFDSTNGRGELASIVRAEANRFSDEMVAVLAEDWKEQPGISVASDFVSVAFTLGRFDVGRGAAEFILADSSGTPTAKGVATLYLAGGQPASSKQRSAMIPDPPQAAPAHTTIAEQLHVGVRETRRQLRFYPRNPILWSNLGRLYTSLGVRDKAAKAIQTALAMAPENRFILRAAARFFLHQGLLDRAHRLLADAACVRSDPWVLSAEIAVAAAMGRSSRNIRVGRRLLEIQRQDPFHLSELASAVGTIESLSGNLRVARPLIAFSLQQPAENAVAQAAWLHRKIGGIGLEQGVTCSFEANAWFALRQAKWESALTESKLWQTDQPFSSRPAIFGSHVASTILDDYVEAEAFARQGLLSNPDDFILQNNLAFALALAGDASGAAGVLRGVVETSLPDQQRVFLMATRGLIAFRAGDLATGRYLYRSAIYLGKRLNNVIEHVARLYYAMEELRAGGADAESIRSEALQGAETLNEPWQQALAEKLRRY
jgi:tetratricopeptide (TPR) repeat protein